ncbi:trans-aconitate 2-methyltransferase [Azospirillum sp. TSH100]|uniref:class I SAM-dependent methyltransferase n=1 Tax=Azospirillum sp. TSH100 TaxID=652764 RepID=UPI0013049F9A|nr:class I SAM-dependent methyltransferase [Azospirillum sp. TSH100]
MMRPGDLRRAFLRTAPGCWLRSLRHLRDRAWREGLRLRLRPPAGLFQPEAITAPDRYGTLFGKAAGLLGGPLVDGPALRLLSFGCADGDEVFALRSYFPAAAIVGLDINPANIARARERHRRAGGDPRLRFECAASAAGEEPGSFDAVFALAVFRHSDLDGWPDRCDRILPFAAVARETGILADRLRPGGLFAFANSHYRGGDLPALAGWTREHVRSPRPAPVYDPGGRLLGGGLQDEGLWRKPGGSR